MHCVSALFVAALALTQPDDPAASQPATQPSSQPATPVWILSKTHYPPEIEDESAYRAWCRKRTADLIAKAQGATDSVAAAPIRLAAANHILSQEIEPSVSRWLLDLSSSVDIQLIRQGLADAGAQIKQAADAMTGQPPAEGGAAGSPHAALEALQAFAGALDALWSAEEPETVVNARQAAATALAVLLEDDRKDVAAAAMLWQAVLYRQMGQMDRAFQLLPPATARISRDARSHQFQTRLLRCRLLAEREGYAAAAALILRIEESVLDWFPTEPEQDAAAHSAMLIRLQIAEKWRASLDPAKHTDEIAWCSRTAERIRAALVADGNPVQLMGLDRVIPILSSPPEPAEPAPDDAEVD